MNTTYEYDTAANTWTQKANFPGAIRLGGIAFVLNDIVYCGTGIDDFSINFAGNCYNDFYAYNPALDSWATLPAAPFPARTYAIAATVSAGKAYAGTGWFSPTTTVYYQDWWEFTPQAATGIQEPGNTDMHISCSPNPNDGLFSVTLSSTTNEPVQVSITDMMGKTVQKCSGVANTLLDIQLDVPAGVYFMNVATQHGKYVSKVVIE